MPGAETARERAVEAGDGVRADFASPGDAETVALARALLAAVGAVAILVSACRREFAANSVKTNWEHILQ